MKIIIILLKPRCVTTPTSFKKLKHAHKHHCGQAVQSQCELYSIACTQKTKKPTKKTPAKHTNAPRTQCFIESASGARKPRLKAIATARHSECAFLWVCLQGSCDFELWPMYKINFKNHRASGNDFSFLLLFIICFSLKDLRNIHRKCVRMRLSACFIYRPSKCQKGLFLNSLAQR